MELEAVLDGILGSSEDDYIVADLLLDGVVLDTGNKGVEDVHDDIEVVAVEAADSSPGGETKEPGQDVPGGEGKDGKEEGTDRKAKANAKRKAKVKAKKNTYKCTVCAKEFPSGQGLGGHMNAHPEVKRKKIYDAYMKIHMNDSPHPEQSSRFQPRPNVNFQQAAQDQAHWEQSDSMMPLDVHQQSSRFQPRPNANFQQAAQDQAHWEQSDSMMPPDVHQQSSRFQPQPNTNFQQAAQDQAYWEQSDSMMPPDVHQQSNRFQPQPNANFQQAAQDQAHWEQSDSMMPPDVQNFAAPCWNTSQADCGYIVECLDPRCVSAHYRQAAQYQEWSQSNPMMAVNAQDPGASTSITPSTSQPYLDYSNSPY